MLHDNANILLRVCFFHYLSLCYLPHNIVVSLKQPHERQTCISPESTSVKYVVTQHLSDARKKIDIRTKKTAHIVAKHATALKHSLTIFPESHRIIITSAQGHLNFQPIDTFSTSTTHTCSSRLIILLMLSSKLTI